MNLGKWIYMHFLNINSLSAVIIIIIIIIIIVIIMVIVIVIINTFFLVCWRVFFKPFTDEAQTAVFKDPVRTAL